MKIINYTHELCNNKKFHNLNKKIIDRLWLDHLKNIPYYQMYSIKSLTFQKNPVFRNAYSYEIQNDKVIFSSFIPSNERLMVYKTFENNFNINYQLKKLDCYCYSLPNFQYIKINKKELNYIIYNFIYEFKNIPSTFTFDYNDIINDLLLKTSLSNIPEKIKKYYISFIKNNNLSEFISFNQGNVTENRFIKINNKITFDYFSHYNKPSFYSYLQDLGQTLYMDKNLLRKYKKDFSSTEIKLIKLFYLLEKENTIKDIYEIFRY